MRLILFCAFPPSPLSAPSDPALSPVPTPVEDVTCDPFLSPHRQWEVSLCGTEKPEQCPVEVERVCPQLTWLLADHRPSGAITESLPSPLLVGLPIVVVPTLRYPE